MRSVIRWAVAIGFGCSLALAGSTVIANDVGRNFSRCVNACDAARKACSQQCVADCKGMFPNDPVQRGSCQSQCVQTCVTNERDCKVVCLAIKNGQSPSQPE
ncbi:MAG TPA: hypothetical protein VFE84_05850 [Patescibacteria group bacterium]|jgi:hypothetical protein|nr:hypothetical protein [Patescibacteria group bacterium]